MKFLTYLYLVCVLNFQPRKKKNVSHDAFGSKLGNIHMQKQSLDKLQTRKMKGLKAQKRKSQSEARQSSAKRSKSVDTQQETEKLNCFL